MAAAMGDADISIISAGIEANERTPVCTVVHSLIDTTGLPPNERMTTGAHQLVAEELASAALIITFTVRQRGVVARLAPESRDRLFTLVEAATLAASIQARRLAPTDLAAWAHLLHANRPLLAQPAQAVRRPRPLLGRRRAPESDPWDIRDAHSASPELHLERLNAVAAHSRRLGTILTGAYA